MTTILVIEDEQLVLENILDMLGVEGFEAVGANDGLTGVDLAKQHLPDLIICDIRMSGLDGYGVLMQLREDPATAMIPFIFLTAKTGKRDTRQGMILGADDYVTKPFTQADLLGSIRARLERRALADEYSERKLQKLRENILTALPHELRTPLFSILGFSEFIMADAGSMTADEITEMAASIHNNALRLHRMFENYLMYMQTELLKADRERIDTLRRKSFTPDANLLIEAEANSAAQQAKRDADLVFNVPETPALQITDDALKKIVEELVDNGFKFSKAGTPVRVIGAVDSDQFRLTITDCGRGMTPEQIAGIGAYMQFDRKVQEQRGPGLGLAVAKSLTELYGGTLTIESIPGDHTAVMIALPLA
ncbi:MAG: response regulator [Anaerolineae bacterium]|nr:response regulator [Anaerolineae bacterium]